MIRVNNKIVLARQIGLMRSGRLLAEESPQALLTMYNCISLEDVFLKLSRKQGRCIILFFYCSLPFDSAST